MNEGVNKEASKLARNSNKKKSRKQVSNYECIEYESTFIFIYECMYVSLSDCAEPMYGGLRYTALRFEIG